jgi:hypothetical protein
MPLLNDIIENLAGTADSGEKSYTIQDFEQNGFITPPMPTADGNGLPASKIRPGRKGRLTRHVAHWFVPEVGIIPMFINPQSINYTNTKLINKERTKGGFIIQYWGEDLSELSLEGHTGSSGVEGLNVLFEIYRAEQYMFDSIALTMAADSTVSGINDLVDSALGGAGIGGILGAAGASVAGLIGGSPTGQSVLPKDVPSLAAMATGIEFYYSGWVFRGYFSSMNITESVDQMGFFKYSIKFVVTQRRGYRTNTFANQRSAVDGFIDPGSSSSVPLSYSGIGGHLPKTGIKSEFGSGGSNPFGI